MADPVAILRDAVGERRCVFVAGLPGTGKTVVLGQAVLLAREAGRTVHRLQWDDARLPFDTPGILARYPEVDGVTHPAIRIAAGRWARGAVARWHAAHPGGGHVLIGETPLAGERLMSLARPAADAVEELLAGPGTLFVVPVPTSAVRAAMEQARERRIDAPDAHDAASARPHLVREHWRDLEELAHALALPVRAPGTWDPDLYADVYDRLLRCRHHAALPIAATGDVDAALAAVNGAPALRPSAREVARWIAEQDARSAADVDREAREWHRAVTA